METMRGALQQQRPGCAESSVRSTIAVAMSSSFAVSVRRPTRIPVVLLSLVLAVSTVSAAVISPGESLWVRVRILEAQRTVSIIGPRGERVEIVDHQGALEINGRDAGSQWHSRDSGPFRVEGDRGGQGYTVRGMLKVFAAPEGLSVINEVPLESYLAGTLGAEMYSSWAPDALRAQAVASRTYVVYQIEKNRAQAFDVVADVSHQRYLGLMGESDSTRSAVKQTRGEIIRYAGRPALAAFHSASGGTTASAREVWGISVPYLKSIVVEEEDDSPDTYWRVSVSAESLELALRELGQPIGQVRSVSVISRSHSGRVTGIEFAGTRGRATVGGRELRQTIGLGVIKSTLFEIRDRLHEKQQGGSVIFMGSGSGHGVGMSQWGAQAMAEKGIGYREILQNFYPGTQLGVLTRADAVGLPAVSLALESAADGRRTEERSTDLATTLSESNEDEGTVTMGARELGKGQ